MRFNKFLWRSMPCNHLEGSTETVNMLQHDSRDFIYISLKEGKRRLPRISGHIFPTSLTLQPIIGRSSAPVMISQVRNVFANHKKIFWYGSKNSAFHRRRQVIWDKQRHRIAINHSGPSMTISRDWTAIEFLWESTTKKVVQPVGN